MPLKKTGSALQNVVVIAALFFLCACTYVRPTQESAGLSAFIKPDTGRYDSYLPKSPCGVLAVKGPLISITGYLPEPENAAGFLRLYIAVNKTVDSVRFAEQHCAVLATIAVQPSGRFSLTDLPQGDYLLTVPMRDCSLPSMPPVVKASREFNYSVESIAFGSTDCYVFNVFSIRQMQIPDTPGVMPLEDWE